MRHFDWYNLYGYQVMGSCSKKKKQKKQKKQTKKHKNTFYKL